MPEIGDTRYMAEWCYEWEPDDDGELYVDDMKYMTAGPFESRREAAIHATTRDIDEAGRVLKQRYEETLVGVGEWQTVETEAAEGVVAEYAERDRLSGYLIPASRWYEFPVLSNRLKGHWAVWKEEKRDYNTGKTTQAAFFVGKIDRKMKDLVKVGYRRLRLETVWIIPSDVPMTTYFPAYDWDSDVSAAMDRDTFMHVLAQGLEHVNAEPWLALHEEAQRDNA